MNAIASLGRSEIRLAARSTARKPYPDAVVAHGLIFTSGARPATTGSGFHQLPSQGTAKRQGYPLVDRDEGRLAESAWGAHATLEAVLNEAGSNNAQILRQHVWQKDKRFFPVYENVRIPWQPDPAPSSGLGVAGLPDTPEAWIGL